MTQHTTSKIQDLLPASISMCSGSLVVTGYGRTHKIQIQMHKLCKECLPNYLQMWLRTHLATFVVEYSVVDSTTCLIHNVSVSTEIILTDIHVKQTEGG